MSGFFEGDLEGVTQIGAPLGATAATLTSAAATAEEGLKNAPAAAEHFFEDIERIMHAAAACTTAHATREGGMSVAVVSGALLVVVQDVISFADFFELLLGRLVVGVFVGVIFHRQFAVGLFEVIRCGVPGDAKDLVVVALVSHE